MNLGPRTLRLLMGGLVCVAGSSVPARGSDQQRAVADRDDLIQGHAIHVVYFLPADRPDRRLDINGVLDEAVRGMDRWFVDRSGGFRLRFDVRTASGLPDTTFVRGEKPADQYRGGIGDIVDELHARGFSRDDADYLVFFDAINGSGACGRGGGYATPPPPATPLTPSRDSPDYLRYALIFLGDCSQLSFGSMARPGTWEAVAMHELAHLADAVHPSAPHHCYGPGLGLGHVCTTGTTAPFTEVARLDPESRDLMFPGILYPLHELELDRGNDDYFLRPGRPLAPDLSDAAWVIPPTRGR